jgi:uncharacterized protein YbaR (Trm112 family)
MRLDLVDLLRCPNDHADTPLVCVAHRARDRELLSATLGCPVCHAEFTVADGVAWLGAGEALAASAAATAASAAAPTVAADLAVVATGSATEVPDDLLRLAAMLDLTSPGGTVALTGEWVGLAAALAALTSVGVVVLADRPLTGMGDAVSVLAGARGVPLARASLRGIALGDEPAAALDARLRAAPAALMHHGRLVAPVSCAVPPGCVELARDGQQWVARREEPPQAVSLKRAPPRTPGQ